MNTYMHVHILDYVHNAIVLHNCASIMFISVQRIVNCQIIIIIQLLLKKKLQLIELFEWKTKGCIITHTD